MTKYFVLLLSFLFIIPAISAQDNKDREKMKEEIQKFKVEFLAKEMGLSDSEKAKFEPIYNEYDEAKRDAGKEAWLFERNLKKNKKYASDDDYKKLAKLQQNAREKGNEIDKKYNKKFESFLTAKQIYQMHQGEEKFFSKMKEMRKKHRHGKGSKSDRPHIGQKAGNAPAPMPPSPMSYDFNE